MIVTSNIAIEEAEKNAYVDYLQQKHGKVLRRLHISVDGDYVDLEYRFEPEPFERIRRITGYLVGDMKIWNDAKSAEEKDRVKHSVEMERL